MKCSELIAELARAMVSEGDREVLISSTLRVQEIDHVYRDPGSHVFLRTNPIGNKQIDTL